MGLLATEADYFPSPACGRGRGPPRSGGRVRVFLFFFGPPDQRFANDVNNAVQVAQHVIVPEAENLETFGFQKRRPLGIPPLVMLPAIDLDDQHRLQAGEVGDVRQQAVLEAEFEAVDLAVAGGLPELFLRVGSVAAELGGVFAYLTADGSHAQDFRRKKTLTQPSPARGRGLMRPLWIQFLPTLILTLP